MMAAIVIAILFFNECVQYKDIPAENKLKMCIYKLKNGVCI